MFWSLLDVLDEEFSGIGSDLISFGEKLESGSELEDAGGEFGNFFKLLSGVTETEEEIGSVGVEILFEEFDSAGTCNSCSKYRDTSFDSSSG